MDIEEFVRLHPLTYVHIAYAVVWVLHFGYAGWIVLAWRRTAREEQQMKLRQDFEETTSR